MLRGDNSVLLVIETDSAYYEDAGDQGSGCLEGRRFAARFSHAGSLDSRHLDISTKPRPLLAHTDVRYFR
jgi:hypothetical protein